MTTSSLPHWLTSLPSIPLGILTSLTFLLSLLLLERSSSSFITHTTRLSTRLHVPPILIALLTAGCEWEELAVVVSALAEGDEGLALGNVWGSCIANVLGGFSIGLLVGVKDLDEKERTSARIYTGLLFALSLFLAIISSSSLLAPKPLEPNANTPIKAVRALGVTLIVLFGIYLLAIGWGIHRGVVVPPENSDSDSDSDSDSEAVEADGNDSDSDIQVIPGQTNGQIPRGRSDRAEQDAEANERTPLVRSSPITPVRDRPSPPSTLRSLLSLLTAIILLSISGILLSLSCTLLSSPKLLNLQSSKLGLTLLPISTTVPEKVLAFKAGRQGQVGVVVANTVGGNVFLGTLVLGLCWVVKGRIGYEAVPDEMLRGSAVAFNSASLGGTSSNINLTGSSLDAIISCACSGVLFLIVWLGWWKRWIGGMMLLAYVGYIVSVFFRD